MELIEYFRLLMEHRAEIEIHPASCNVYTLTAAVNILTDEGLCKNIIYNVSGEDRIMLHTYIEQYVRRTMNDVYIKYGDELFIAPFGEGSPTDRFLSMLGGLHNGTSPYHLYDKSDYGQERWTFIEWVLNQTTPRLYRIDKLDEGSNTEGLHVGMVGYVTGGLGAYITKIAIYHEGSECVTEHDVWSTHLTLVEETHGL